MRTCMLPASPSQRWLPDFVPDLIEVLAAAILPLAGAARPCHGARQRPGLASSGSHVRAPSCSLLCARLSPRAPHARNRSRLVHPACAASLSLRRANLLRFLAGGVEPLRRQDSETTACMYLQTRQGSGELSPPVPASACAESHLLSASHTRVRSCLELRKFMTSLAR
jgi:hypothetical protein